MSTLAVTLIDVGWGDSVLVEATDNNGDRHFGLIDSNDTNISRSSFLFVKRFFERENVQFGRNREAFEFMLLTHAHADHASGLKEMMSTFGTDWYWYPKSDAHVLFGDTVRYARRSRRVRRHQAIDRTKNLPNLGDAQLKVLWPPYTPGPDPYDRNNPNNNSVVLLLTLDRVRFVLTGDCEAENWHQINDRELRSRVKMFKVPHHGAENGLFDDNGQTPWLDRFGVRTKLGMSLHVRHGHPHPSVVREISRRGNKVYRTDSNYHVTFETDGRRVTTKWSRVSRPL